MCSPNNPCNRVVSGAWSQPWWTNMLRMSTSQYFSRIHLLGWLARCRYVLLDGSNTFIMARVSTNRTKSNTNSKINEQHNNKLVLVYMYIIKQRVDCLPLNHAQTVILAWSWYFQWGCVLHTRVLTHTCVRVCVWGKRKGNGGTDLHNFLCCNGFDDRLHGQASPLHWKANFAMRRSSSSSTCGTFQNTISLHMSADYATTSSAVKRRHHILATMAMRSLISLINSLGPIADISAMRLSASWCHFLQWLHDMISIRW